MLDANMQALEKRESEEAKQEEKRDKFYSEALFKFKDDVRELKTNIVDFAEDEYDLEINREIIEEIVKDLI